MVTLTLSLPEDLKQEMEEAVGIDWSEVAQEAIRGKLIKLRLFKVIASKSKLTEKDALELGRKVNHGLHERYKKMFPEAY